LRLTYIKKLIPRLDKYILRDYIRKKIRKVII